MGRPIGDNPRFPNCLDGDEGDRAMELEYPDPQNGCSYTSDNIRPTEPSTTPRFCFGEDLPPGSACLTSSDCRGYDPVTGADCHDFSQGSCIQRCQYPRTPSGFSRELRCLSWGHVAWDPCDVTVHCPTDHTCMQSAGPNGDAPLRYLCVPDAP